VLNKHLKSFSRLRTDKNRKRWSALTTNQAPHKPFLLLSIMDLIAQGAINQNFIDPSYELVETWNGYWNSIMPVGSRGIMSYPFYHMRTELFWQLLPNEGYKDQSGLTVSSMVKLREIYSGAEMDEELFQILCDPQTREQLRLALIDTYFAAEVRVKVLEQGHLNYAAYQYSEKLLQAAEEEKPFEKPEDEPDWQKKIRDSGFRRTIVNLYQHRCALCGIRMLTPEGHTIVDAAHVKPWKDSFDDRPTNGMALCKLCHWSFDKGLMSVGKDYEVLVSKRVQVEKNLPGHILTLSDRSIFTPDEKKFWPEQDNLHWHRKRIFKSN